MAQVGRCWPGGGGGVAASVTERGVSRAQLPNWAGPFCTPGAETTQQVDATWFL